MKRPKRSTLLLLAGLLYVLGCQTQRLATPSPTGHGGEWDVDNLRAVYSQSQEHWYPAEVDSGVAFRELGLLPEVEHPADNAYDPAKVALGRQLFFDPRLSGSNQIACATCHDPELGWTDGRSKPFGHDRQLGRRNTPTILNAGHWEKFFWDGRALSLEDQALFPIQDPVEMHQDLEELERELNGVEGYREQFRDVFGVEKITRGEIARALAAFQRTIVSRKSRFDRFLEGRHEALSDEEVLGLHLFRTKARCINCHNGPFLTDQQFHNDGFTFFGRHDEDLGLYDLTGKPADVGRFRTPSLRDVLYTGPWMHTGTMADLDEILTMYNLGMPQPIPRHALDDGRPLPESSHLLKPLNLTEREIDALKAFLGAVSREPVTVRLP